MPTGWFDTNATTMETVQRNFIVNGGARGKEYAIAAIAMSQAGVDIVERTDPGRGGYQGDPNWGITTANWQGANKLGKIHTKIGQDLADQLQQKGGTLTLSGPSGQAITITQAEVDKVKTRYLELQQEGKLDVTSSLGTQGPTLLVQPTTFAYGTVQSHRVSPAHQAARHGQHQANATSSHNAASNSVPNNYVAIAGQSPNSAISKILNATGAKGIKIDNDIKGNGEQVIKLKFNSPQEAHAFGQQHASPVSKDVVILKEDKANSIFQSLNISRRRSPIQALRYDLQQVATPALSNQPPAAQNNSHNVQTVRANSQHSAASNSVPNNYVEIAGQKPTSAISKILGSTGAKGIKIDNDIKGNGEQVIKLKFNTPEDAIAFKQQHPDTTIPKSAASVVILTEDKVNRIFQGLTGQHSPVNALRYDLHNIATARALSDIPSVAHSSGQQRNTLHNAMGHALHGVQDHKVAQTKFAEVCRAQNIPPFVQAPNDQLAAKYYEAKGQALITWVPPGMDPNSPAAKDKNNQVQYIIDKTTQQIAEVVVGNNVSCCLPPLPKMGHNGQVTGFSIKAFNPASPGVAREVSLVDRGQGTQAIVKAPHTARADSMRAALQATQPQVARSGNGLTPLSTPNLASGAQRVQSR